MKSRKRPCSWKCDRSRCGAGRRGRRNWKGKEGTPSARGQSQKKVPHTPHSPSPAPPPHLVVIFLPPVWTGDRVQHQVFQALWLMRLRTELSDGKPSISRCLNSSPLRLPQSPEIRRRASARVCAAGYTFPSSCSLSSQQLFAKTGAA